MDASTPEGKIMATLKQELRARGLHYRDIASRLRVSEGTVKRYLTGKGVSLTVLRKLTEVAGHDLLTLATLADEQQAGQSTFSKAQQMALGKNKFISAVFFLLWHGWTPAQISREFEITDTLDTALAKLESLGVIRRLAHGVKILATPSVGQRGGGPLADLTHDTAREFLADLNLRDPRCDWTSYGARLSQSSFARLHEMIAKFVEDTRHLTIDDAAVPREQVQWYHVFVAAQPISRKRILRQS